jgi:glycosyltransferase involved in cell wall biosynthesis
MVLLSIFSLITYREIYKTPKILTSFAAIIYLLRFVGLTEWNKKWFEKNIISCSEINLDTTLFYTVDLDREATAFGLLKEKWPEIKLISRARGFDFHEERYPLSYIPCRDITINNVDYIYFISEHGKEYMNERYPYISGKSEVFPRGIDLPNFQNAKSDDGKIRFVSCSNVIPIKRVDLIATSLITLANRNPQQKYEWTHIGAGVELNRIKTMVKRLAPKNFKFKFLGRVPNRTVINYYRKNSVDLFIHLSEFEGGRPVAIQEALGCGIPVFATNVGGISELIKPNFGMLLPNDPIVEDVILAISHLLDNRENLDRHRRNIQIFAKLELDAKKNYGLLAKDIIERFSRAS